MDARSANTGQPGWDTWIDALVAEHGSLVAVAERLAALRSHAEDVASIERALRRLRARGAGPGGKWGERLLRTFGVPRDVDERLRFMGSYHSRFVDLPVPLCADLVQLWDRPPTSESRPGRTWLSLARAVLALRGRDFADAAQHLATARAALDADPAAAVELGLGEAYLASRGDHGRAAALLAGVEGALATVSGPDGDDLRARWVGQRAWLLHRAGRFPEGEALHRALPDAPGTSAYARARRANGLAYARWRLGDDDAALELARTSARHAGDAGHVRLRAMALVQIARIAPGTPEGDDARARARGIARMLGDETLIVRAETRG